MIGVVALLIIFFVIGIFKFKNDRLNRIFEKLLSSNWLFLFLSILFISSLIIFFGSFTHIFGKWDVILMRLLPFSMLIASISLESIIFQQIYSGGKLRFPAPLNRIQPLLKDKDNFQADPIKRNILLYVLIILIPVIITGFLVLLQKPALQNFRPSENDEIVYWHEIASFKQYGFTAGNFSFNELIANGIFSHFGGHGPVFGITYGLLGRLLGWRSSSGPLFNLIMICVSLGLFLWITRPNNRQSILLVFLLGLFFPLLYYIPTIMQESFNFSLAILICAFLVRLSRDNHPPIIIKICSILVLILATALRITWVFAAFPMFYFLWSKKSRHRLVGPIIVATLLSAGMIFLYVYWTSEYPVGFLYSILHQNSIKDVVILFLQHLKINSKLFFRTTEITKLEIVFQYQFLAVTLLYAINRKSKNSLSNANLFMLVSILIFTFFLYDYYDMRPLRTMACFLLVGLMSLPFFVDQRFLSWFIRIYIVINILTFGFFNQLYTSNLTDHFSVINFPMEQGFVKTIQDITVKPTESPWCNSLLTSYPYFNEVRILPPGIGINLLITQPENLEVKSHYIFLPITVYKKYNLGHTCDPLFESSGRIFCVRNDDNCSKK
jgi:hypothetical protein